MNYLFGKVARNLYGLLVGWLVGSLRARSRRVPANVLIISSNFIESRRFGLLALIARRLVSLGDNVFILRCTNPHKFCTALQGWSNLQSGALVNESCRACQCSSGLFSLLGHFGRVVTPTLASKDYVDFAEKSDVLPLTELEDSTFLGIALFEHVNSAVVRFFAHSQPKEFRDYETICRLAYKSAAYYLAAIDSAVRENQISTIIVDHGIYIPGGLGVEYAKLNRIEVSTWNIGYRSGSIITCKNESYHKGFVPKDKFEKIQISTERLALVDKYLKDREVGRNDWVKFTKYFEPERLDRKFDLAIFTNVSWDAQVHFENAIFQNMKQWLDETIAILSRTDLRVAVRLHPGERLGAVPSNENLVEYIQEILRDMNVGNIEIIGPSSQVSSYDLLKQSKSVAVYSSKIGLEAACRGIPVLVAGDAWYKGRGFTFDATSIVHYRHLLEGWVKCIPQRLPAKKILDAKGFFYYLFFEKTRVVVPQIGLRDGLVYGDDISDVFFGE